MMISFTVEKRNKKIVPIEEVEVLSCKYHSRAQMYIGRFVKWIGLSSVNIPEYKLNQDEVDASKNINLNPSWFLG